MSSNHRMNRSPKRIGGHGPMRGMASVEKAKDFKGTIKRLAGYLKPQAWQIALVMVMAIISVVFSIAAPKILGQATNQLFDGIISKTVTNQIKENFGGEIPEDFTTDTLLHMIDVFSSENLVAEAESGAVSREELKAALLKSDDKYVQGMAAAVDHMDDASLSEMIKNFGGSNLEDMKEMLRSSDITIGKDAGIDFAAVGRILLLLIGVYLLSAFFNWMQHFIMAGVAQRTVYRLRREVDQKLKYLPLKYYDNNTRGDILSRVTNDVDNIANTLQQSLTQLITVLFTILGVIIMMFTINWLLTLITLLTLPVCIVITMFIAKRSQKQFKIQWDSTGKLNGQIEEVYTGHSIVKAFNRQQHMIDEFTEENERLYQSSFKAQFISNTIQPVMNFINNLNYVAICVIGGIKIAGGQITLGDVQAFIQYSKQFTMPIVQTASIMNTLQSTVASAERVFELLDEPQEVADPEHPAHLEAVKGNIEFRHVSFHYSEEKKLIEDMNLEVKPGQTVAIVGPTGAGKTTIVNLLMRFYELNSGSITVDGVDIRDMARDDLRNIFGMVLQDTWLFNGTIRANIAYGSRGNASEEEILAASKAAYANHFIKTLPEGYDTVLSDDATNISQGQKQLLTIARAFLSNPQILILDEATSSVDTRTEILIQKAMDRLMQGRTSFVIAHRLSTIRNADIILVMNQGSIIEQGSHEELMAQKGFYCDLYNSQFEAKEVS